MVAEESSGSADEGGSDGGRWLAGNERRLAAGLAVAGGVVALVVSTQLFPAHSLNHDESVYLTQAAMLLEGRLSIRPPVPEAFRPWFFVERADGTLYPKYSPVPAAMFAVGQLLGGVRLALAGIAAGVTGLTYLLVTELFDRRRGLVAAAVLLVSPLFVLQSGVFLPYLPTTLWNLVFAVAYLRADRTGSSRAAAVAGVGVGVAFFARPYTAVLFATPFILHAVWTVRTGGGSPGGRVAGFDRAGVRRAAITAALGVGGVGVTLGYNAVVTGAPTRFPYQAFAPADGIGFGTRRILGYSREYTPMLAVRANAAVVVSLFGRWVAGGPVGTLLAVGGLAALARRLAGRVGGATPGVTDTETGANRPALAADAVTARRLALAGTFLTVIFGNVAFWGNLNILGSLGGGNGLIDALGPYYHFDLLVPTAAFAADGAVRLTRRVAGWQVRFRPRRVARLALVGVIVVGLVVPSAGYAAGPVERNGDVTRTYQSAYAVDVPDDAVVLLPTPLGEWLGHPYQAYRNDPSFDEGPVYALPTSPFSVAEAFPDRPIYRYGYRGEWAPLAGQPVTPHLQRLSVREAPGVRVGVRMDVPRSTSVVSARLSDGEEGIAFAGNGSLAGERTRLGIAVEATGSETARVRLTGPFVAVSDEEITVSGRDRVTLRLFADYGTGAGLTYRFVVPIRVDDGTVAVMTPVVEVCERPQLCGGEAAYVPGETPGNVTVTTRLTATANETA